ncbi:ABC transporter permease [Aristaeella lactis]|uniref:ABC transport system permease protein n=1 Tax=Aristaeella lactis TaxID=3046383 RepID=A0AC61PN77_9FIRM|nr:ABC transporter permease [Aristaeella lactis]QUA52831.1 ABC transporter permease [Aristaeella lactis]SMC74089.1 putative ABC transport system permease protein [Aristaeella lactis]
MLKTLRKKLITIRESAAMALDNIRSNKVRSFLTLLGIMIGVMAVITLISTVSGVSGTISSSFSDMGVGTLTVSVTGSDLKTGMTPEDLQVITELENVDGVVPSISLNGRVSYGNNVQTGMSVSGKNAYYFDLNGEMIIQGRTLNFIDDDNRSYVCVISQKIVDEFFLGINPVGETLYVSGLPFTIVGRYEEDSGGGIASIFMGSPDVMIPYTTAMKVNNSNEVTSFTVYLKDGADSAAAKEEIEDAMDVLFDFEEDCYTVASMESIEETMNTMTTMLSSLLAGIASIALLVGGIGIMNMMLTTVTERTTEIGLKKALGAVPGQIQMQFLLESFLLSMIGGLLGVAFGLALSYWLCQLLGTNFVLNMGAIALGVGFSAAVGIIFGWAPARKASRLNPIDALRAV